MDHYGKEVCTMIKRYKVRHLLIRAEKARGRLLQPLFHSIGLTFGQGHARILDSLLARDHVTQKELADICHMDVTTMSRSLDRLEESGYLVRERDPGCRRSFHICLTKAGVDEAEKVHQILEFADRQIWKGLSEEEMEQFCSSLEKICDNLENCDTSKGPF